MSKVLLLDTETNGREPAEVIELAYAELTPGPWKLEPLSIFRGLYKPAQGSTPGALATHHILDEDLENYFPSTDAKLPADVGYIVGYKIDYDWEALGKPDVKRICILAIARTVCPGVGQYTLGAMVYHLFPHRVAREMLKNAHSAVADVDMCWQVLSTMLAAVAFTHCTAEQLWQWSEDCRTPKNMPFGKHKDKPISSLPYDYKAWCLKQPDFDPYVLKAIRESL